MDYGCGHTQDFFGGKALCKSVHPDEAVALGAAVQGAILNGVRDAATQSLLLVDVIPLSLGVECEGKHFAKVVPRNTSIPCKKTSEFTTVSDWQTEIDIRVFEGERSHTDGNNLLGEFSINGVERARRGEAKVDVTFEVNANGLLQVRQCLDRHLLTSPVFAHALLPAIRRSHSHLPRGASCLSSETAAITSVSFDRAS